MPDKAVVISTVGGESTYAGGPLGVYGNIICLKTAGYEVTNLVIGASRRSNHSEFETIFIESNNESEKIASELKRQLELANPDVVWLHHYWVWEYFKDLAITYPFVLLSGDPDWEILSLRYKNARKEKNPLKRLYRNILHLRQVVEAKNHEKKVFKSVQLTKGLLACWCPTMVANMYRTIGVKIVSCPLGFPDFGIRKTVLKQHLLMLGNLDGANTRSGVNFFLNKFWPQWRVSGFSSKYRMRMVGSGNLPRHLVLPPNSDKFEWVGYVSDLRTEWENAFALFVPVPESMGFRTRVVESWIRGVPVLAHPVNEKSVPELRPWHNYLPVSDAFSMEQAITKLRDDNYYQEIVENGRHAYLHSYSIDSLSALYGDLSFKAITLKEAK